MIFYVTVVAFQMSAFAVDRDALVVDENGSIHVNTQTGATPLYISRDLSTDQALSIKVGDNNVNFYSEQDEDDNKQRGGFHFYMDDDGSMKPYFSVRLKSGPELFSVYREGYTKINGNLDVNGNIRAAGWPSNSDLRWKENIEPIEDPLDLVTQLRGVSYDWIDSSRGNGRQIGVIAQEVEQVLPEVVHTDSQGYKSVEYSKLVAPLIEAVKVLKDENDLIRAENEALKAENQALRERDNELEKRLTAIESKLSE
jgi:hypothetical protein